jgi:RNA polymerase sigma-70 factor (ECF subfamily)
MAEQTDEELVENSRHGDLLAFKALVIRHEGKVAGVVRSMLGVTPEADDVGQEVFIRFYKALAKFRGESAVGTYLTRIAINLSLNEIKRRKRRFSIFAKEEDGSHKGTVDDRTDMDEMITYEFNQLDPDFRSVATLRLIEGYSTEETATILGIPLGTVLSRLARAQKKLRAGLEKHLN